MNLKRFKPRLHSIVGAQCFVLMSKLKACGSRKLYSSLLATIESNTRPSFRSTDIFGYQVTTLLDG